MKRTMSDQQEDPSVALAIDSHKRLKTERSEMESDPSTEKMTDGRTETNGDEPLSCLPINKREMSLVATVADKTETKMSDPPACMSMNEDVLKHLLTFMDFDSIDCFMNLIYDQAIVKDGVLRDNKFWRDMLLLIFKGEVPSRVREVRVPTVRQSNRMEQRKWDWCDRDATCSFAVDFFRSGDDLNHFKHSVCVVRGDIGRITQIEDQNLDAISFPTNAYLANANTGAAGAVFRRAGSQLGAHIDSLSLVYGNRPIGHIEVTPAFDAGVRRLIHCVGPRVNHPRAMAMLAETYDNMMQAILREDLHCVALALISTGSLRVPVPDSAKTGLEVICKYLRANPQWQGRLGIVCYDQRSFDTVDAIRDQLMASYNQEPEEEEVQEEEAEDRDEDSDASDSEADDEDDDDD